MATAVTSTSVPKFHNHSDHQLADELGRADARLKAAQAEVDALKAELKARGVTEAIGSFFSVTIGEQIAARLDNDAIKALLGAELCKFQKPVISSVVRVKALPSLAMAAA